jgi:transposase
MPYKFKRITQTKVNKILKCFASDISATQTAKIVGANRNTINDWFNMFREKILEYQEHENGSFHGEVELDESYFGGQRKKLHAKDRRKRGRGAENKVPVFGIKKRDDGRVYTQIIKNASKQELLPIIRRLVAKNNTTIYTDKWKSYDGLVLDGYKHKRINHSKTYSNRKGTHVNGIENFWSFSKRRLAKFNGVSRKTFLLHLKECEFRYNHKHDILRLLKVITGSLLV